MAPKVFMRTLCAPPRNPERFFLTDSSARVLFAAPFGEVSRFSDRSLSLTSWCKQLDTYRGEERGGNVCTIVAGGAAGFVMHGGLPSRDRRGGSGPPG